MRSFTAHGRAMRRVVIAVVMVLVVVLGLPLGAATAYQVATSVTQAGQVVTGNTPSGWTWKVTSTGQNTVLDTTSSPGTYAATSAMFTPAIATTAPMDRITTNLSACPGTGLCSGLGTIKIDFSQPVKNPVLHLMGIGAQASNGGNGTIFHVIQTLSASTPAGATLGSASAGAANMTVVGGTTIDAVNYLASTSCGSMTTGATALSVCGSVPVVGTVTSITLTTTAQAKAYAGSGTASSGAADAWGILVTAPQDLGDAPASYDVGGAAANVIGDLTLGSAIDADSATVANPTTSPNAVAAGSSANGVNGDGADEDAVSTWPALTTAAIGSSYAATVPISGASQAGQVCGWIDFNRSGAFDSTEKACTSFVAGATSVTLTWTVPAATSAGMTYARLRTAYGAATMSPTGALDSGETEDYSVAIMPAVRITKVLAAGSSGTFDLAVNGTTLASGVGNGGTTGTKTVFDTSAYGAPNVTVAQSVATTAVPLTLTEANSAGNTRGYTTSYSCVNGAGTTVASGATTSAAVTIPASTGSNGTAQNISCTFTNTQLPSISLVKSVSSVTDANGNGQRDAGDKINYSFLVTNTGGSALTAVGVSDPKVSGISCPGATLALGASMTCTATYTITQADTDAGSVPNTATATGTGGSTVVTATSSVSTSIPANPALSLQKSVTSVVDTNGDGVRDAGDKVNWTFKVTNTGTVTITTVAVTDPKAGAISCPATTLAPGAATTCTATAYTISQAEGDAAVVTNTATATGKSPAAATVTSNASSTSTALVRTPAVTLTKSAVVTDVNGNGKTDLGDKIAWSFLVKNTGNVTLTSVAITDAKAGGTTCPLTTLAPGVSTTCTATTPYTITQTDVDAGSVTNTATAGATQPSGATLASAPSSTTTPVVQTSALQLTKSAAVTDVNADGLTDLGDRITWSFLVKNTGTVTLTTLAVSDPSAGAVTCVTTTLAPGATTTCTATAQRTITQADVDSGVVSNTGTATAKTPGAATVTSNSSSTATAVAQSTSLALLKTAAVTDVNGNGKTDLGDTIQWSFRATNNGTVTLTGLAVSDAKAGATTCPLTTLAPGAQTTCTATAAHPITQAEVDAGVVNNTATVSAKNPGNATVTSAPSSTSTPVNQVATLQLTKSAAVTDLNGNGQTDLGDKITWSFLVKNTGTVTDTSVAVTDPTAGAISCPATTLAPAVSTTCTSAAHIITQSEVDAGVVNNTATATGKSPANATITSNSSSTSTPIAQTATLQLTKSAAVSDVNANGKTDLGDRIAWSFLVKNTGTVTITTAAIADVKAGPTTCPVTTLAPGASTTCTATTPYSISQSDVDNGVVSNTATATGKSPSNASVTSNASQTDTPVNQAPALQLTKSAAVTDANGDGRTNLGDRITWSFLVKNTGNVSLTTLAIADAKAGATTCPVTTLAPGVSTTCTATTAYVISQGDVDAGIVNNTATATTKNPSGVPVTSNSSSTSTAVAQTAGLQLTKSASVTDLNGDGVTDLGDRVTWSFLVQNTGTTTLSAVAVADAKAGAAPCLATTVAPGGSTTCTSGGYLITQADVDNGVLSNTAVTTGKDPSGATVTSNPSQTDTPIVQSGAVQLTKTAGVTDVDADGATDLGDTVTWSFLVKNSGTTTVSAVAVNDPTAGAVSCPATTLAPGVATTCTATTPHLIVQADVDAGVVSNTATATAQTPGGTTLTSNSSHTDTPVNRSSVLKLVKKAAVTDVNGDFKTDLGDTITWTFQLTNTGTTTLTAAAVADAKAGPVSCPVTTLAPGGSTTCTANATYPITQADVDAGVVNNTAGASATGAGGAAVTSNPSSTSTPVIQSASLQLTKSAAVTDVNADAKTDLGDTIAWSFLVKNTGTTTLTTAAVSDGKAGSISCPATTLAPGASTTCTSAAYTITQPDVDGGVVNNTATATAKSPAGATVTSNSSSTSTPVGQTSALQLTKSAGVSDVNADGKTDLGDQVTWSFVVKNTGTVTINAVAVNDAKAGPISCPATTLAPGGSTTCTAAAHVVSQADVDAGFVTNTASATGTKPGGATVTSNPSTTDTPVAQASTLQLTKSAAVTDVNGNGKTDLGDRITWSFLVQNSGTTTITSLVVNDPTAGAVSCPATTLAPGANVTCTSSAHTVSQADVDAGLVTNTATASGSRPGGATVTSNPSSTSTPIAQANSLLLTKSAVVNDIDGDFLIDKGDKLQWSFLVKNTGTGTISGLAVNDPIAGVVTCPASSLTPGASTTCTASVQHVISQADVDAGVVNNTATATGSSPSGSAITSNPSATSTPVAQTASLTLTKSAAVTDANTDGVTDLGDTVTWTFLVKNTGTVTATTVAVTDAKAGAVSCPATTLAPGASTTCTAGGHTVTQADVDAGVVSNTATAAGKAPSGATITAAPSSTDTPVTQVAGLSLTKSAAVTDVDADGAVGLGDRIAWSFLVKDTGTTTVTSVAVSDAKAGAVSCPVTTLAPGASTSCSSSAYVISQADVDAGVVSNTATASAKDPKNATVTAAPSSTDTPIAQLAALTLTKSAAVTDLNADGKTDLGDQVTWSFLVRDSGTTTITSVAVNDPTAGGVTCPVTTLAPGAATTCTSGAHTVSQADVDAGVIANTATVSGRDPANHPVTSSPSSTSTAVAQLPAMTLTKSASVTDLNSNFIIDLGDRISWSLLVKNTGTTTINTVAVSDPNAGPVTCPVSSLAPGASTTCTAAAHVITQADVDAGIVTNTATASAKDPQGAPIGSAPSTADTPVAQSSGLQLTKTALVTDLNGDGQTDLGDKVTWSFLVKDSGTVSVTTLAVNDPKAGAVSCPTTALAPGASTTCTSAPYTITQADVDAGLVTNTASATGKNPSGAVVTSNSSSTTTPVVQAPALLLTKSAAVTDVNADGQTNRADRVVWSFLVKNTGTTTLNPVAVTDATAGAVTCPGGALAPGASVICTSSPHTVTQTDVDAGVISNTATASGRTPSGASLTSNPSSTDTPVAQAPAVSLTKSAAVTDVDGNGATDLGDTIVWSFLVRNTGTTTVTSVAVNDPKAGVISCPATTLAPGGTTTCTSAPYSVTQPDVDAGRVTNTATASAVAPGGATVTSPPSSTDTPIARSPGLSLVKSAATLDRNGDFTIDLGDVISWTFLVKNTGTTTVTSMSVNDATAGAISCPSTTLAPGASTTCTSSPHPISQTDVDAGVVSNTATASGTPAGGGSVAAPPSSTDTPVSQVTGLSLVKSAAVTDVNADGMTDLADTISWSFVVKNTGTTTVGSVAVDDPTAGVISCPATTLAPGVSTTCTSAAHPISQADVDAGHVANTATASGQTPGGAALTSPPSSTDTAVAQSPLLTMTKSATVTDVNGDGRTDLADQISWSFLVHNTGTTTLTAVAVADGKAGPVSCPTTTLPPGASTTCTATTPYVVSQADVDAGLVSNTATASAQDPSGQAVPTAPSSTDTAVDQAPALTLVKAATVTDVNHDGRPDITDRISWTFEVTNSGTTTVTSVAVDDPTAGPVTCPVTTLAPGASTTCTATAPYTITQADVDAGHVDNTATASAAAPSGAAVPSNPSTVSTWVAQRPNPALWKTAVVDDLDGDGATDLGDTISWSFLVENTGNVTLDTVEVTDPVAGAVSCPSTTLAVGGTMTCTAADHVISQADVDAGLVHNTAVATGHSPGTGTTTSNDSSTDTPVDQQSRLSVTKSAAAGDADGDGVTDLGDPIAWSFLVQNTGTTTLTNVRVDDPKAGPVWCPATTLAPNASTTCTATAPYVITQTDVDAAHVANTATATGTDPSGSTHTSAPSSTDTPVAHSGAVTIAKSAAVTDQNADGATDLGDTVAWSFVLHNAGTTTLNNVTVDDPLAGPVSCPVTTLAPGGATTCTADGAHQVTQGDVDNGVVSNTATASASDPDPVTSSPSSTDTPVQQVPGLALTKSALAADTDADGRIDLGDSVTWTFLVQNTGTVTVHGVSVTDPIAGAVSCPATTLTPAASTTCTAAAHAVTQADVDAGVVDNTATASALTPAGAVTTSNPSSTSTPVTQSPAVQLTKSAAVTDVDADGRTDRGDTITWSFLVTDSGTTTVTTVAVADPKAGAVSCPLPTLTPGASTTCTSAPYAITQGDVDAGVVANTATASAKSPSGASVTSPPSSTDTPVDQSPAVAVQKGATVTDVDGDGRTDLGDRVSWSFLVTNVGTTSLTGVTVNDAVASGISCPVTVLARGASTTCTSAAYTVTQPDVDAGVVANTATAGAVDPHGNPILSAPSSTDTPVAQAPALTVTKAAAVDDVDDDGRIDLGDSISWSFVVKNVGTTTVHAVVINDPKAGPTSCPAATLAPGASTTCVATTAYLISQADVDAGAVSNTATASAVDPAGAGVTAPPSSTDTAVDQAPALTLTKSAVVVDVDGDGRIDRGDAIDWSFLVTNTGTTTVTTLDVVDPTAGAVSCPVTALTVGASTTCTAAAFTITQPDVDAGLVTNTAHATAADPSGGAVVSPDSSTDTAIDQVPSLSVVKTAAVTDVDADGRTDLGDSIDWSFLVTNTGTTTVTALAVLDPMAGATTCPVATLAPGEVTTCTATAAHAVSQSDVDAGTVSNTARATGTSAGVPVVSAPSTTDTRIGQTAALSASKHASVTDVNHDGRTGLGDRISWSVTVSNTGTVTVHGLSIVDPLAGAMTCLATTLAPGATTTCTATTPYTITQPEVDAGTVDNTATATGRDPAGAPVTAPPASVSTPVVSVSALTLTKTAAVFDVDGDGVHGVGDTISWSFHVTNSGSTTLVGLSIDDPIAGAVTCPVTTLAPAASTTCRAAAPHPVTQAEVDLGDVTNTATAAALDPAAALVTSPPSSTDTELDQLVAIRLVKHGVATDLNHDGLTDAGDTILWTFDVTNIGRVTLNALDVSDTRAGPVTCAVSTLAVGASTTCASTTPYVITAADEAAGAVHNVATATGSCGCRATVKAVKAAAVVATRKTGSGSHHRHHPHQPGVPGEPGDPSDPGNPSDPASPIVPGLPFTGAMGVAWAVRGGLMAVVIGAFLLVATRRRRDDEDEGGAAVAV